MIRSISLAAAPAASAAKPAHTMTADKAFPRRKSISLRRLVSRVTPDEARRKWLQIVTTAASVSAQYGT